MSLLTLSTQSQRSFENAVVDVQTLPLAQVQPLQYLSQETTEEDAEVLYQSIEQHGLQQPFVVSQPPENNNYVLVAGGNIRLEIVRRLNEESRRTRFSEVECVVVPWPGLGTVKINHLITNDVIHSASFFARTKAIIGFINENDDLPIDHTTSDREVSKYFREQGLPLYRTTYGAMKYAIDVLERIFPQALTCSFTTQDVKRIQVLERKFKAHWLDLGQPESAFDQIFANVAAKCDHEELSYQSFHREFVERIDAELRKVHLSSPNSASRGEPTAEETPSRSIEDTAAAPIATSQLSSKLSLNGGAREEMQSPEVSLEPTISVKLTSKIHKLATQLAAHFDLDNCISKQHRGKVGFLVVELPPQAEDSSNTARLIWEYLANFSGVCDMSKSELLPLLDAYSRLSYEFRDREQAPSLQLARNLDLSVLWRLDTKTFHSLLQLWKAVSARYQQHTPSEEFQAPAGKESSGLRAA